MSGTSEVGGYRPVPEEVDYESDRTPPEEGPVQFVEASSGKPGAALGSGRPVLGGTGTYEAGADLLEAALRESETAAGTAASADGVQEAGSVAEIKQEISDLEMELERLYDRRDDLEERLRDPDLGFWEAPWLEWDLADTEYEICKLEEKLGKLEQGLFEKILEDTWEKLFSWLDTCTGLDKVVSAKIDKGVARNIEERETGRGKENLQRERLRHDRLRGDVGLKNPIPADSPALRKELDKLRREAEMRRAEGGPEALDEIRHKVIRLRERFSGRS